MLVPQLEAALERGQNELHELAVLLAEMDRAYQAVAAHYRLDCQGCADNCCQTLFHHHTLAEYLYMYAGLRTLAAPQRAECLRAAQAFQRSQAEAAALREPLRVWCPLSLHARCRLYAFRPMICRLHGVPNRFRHPVRGSVSGPGCHRLSASSPEAEAPWLDRTPLYQRLADIERRLRARLAWHARVNMTVADMLSTMEPHPDPAVAPPPPAPGPTRPGHAP